MAEAAERLHDHRRVGGQAVPALRLAAVQEAQRFVEGFVARDRHRRRPLVRARESGDAAQRGGGAGADHLAAGNPLSRHASLVD